MICICIWAISTPQPARSLMRRLVYIERATLLDFVAWFNLFLNWLPLQLKPQLHRSASLMDLSHYTPNTTSSFSLFAPSIAVYLGQSRFRKSITFTSSLFSSHLLNNAHHIDDACWSRFRDGFCRGHIFFSSSLASVASWEGTDLPLLECPRQRSYLVVIGNNYHVSKNYFAWDLQLIIFMFMWENYIQSPFFILSRTEFDCWRIWVSVGLSNLLP